MIQRREILRHAWEQLRPGSWLVIMDARIPKGMIGNLYRPLAMWTLVRTVLGNPDVDILEDLRQLAGRIDVQGVVSRNLFHWSGDEAFVMLRRKPDRLPDNISPGTLTTERPDKRGAG